MTEFKPIKEGKVREIYDNGDSLIMVATDRISAFDVILKNKVTKKGTVLTQMSKFWFDYTRDLLPNHMLRATGSTNPSSGTFSGSTSLMPTTTSEAAQNAIRATYTECHC